jgi:hypothetical protein
LVVKLPESLEFGLQILWCPIAHNLQQDLATTLVAQHKIRHEHFLAAAKDFGFAQQRPPVTDAAPAAGELFLDLRVEKGRRSQVAVQLIRW